MRQIKNGETIRISGNCQDGHTINGCTAEYLGPIDSTWHKVLIKGDKYKVVRRQIITLKPKEKPVEFECTWRKDPTMGVMFPTMFDANACIRPFLGKNTIVTIREKK